MLILTRREGETLLIGDNIEITVLAVSGSQVRLGIEAPRDVPVFREEVVRTQPESAASAASEFEFET